MKKQKAETNNLIFESAKSFFEEIGLENTSMKKIATRAGIIPVQFLKAFRE